MALQKITEQDLLKEVKIALGIGGSFQDKTISFHIAEVKEFLLDAGITESLVESSKAVGVICRGVADLWNYGAGEAKFSDYFIMRATQLALSNPKSDIPTAETESF